MTNQNLIHVLVLGDSGAGKTTLIQKMTNGSDEETTSSAHIDKYPIQIQYNGIEYVLELIDTAGQDKFRTTNKQYFHQTNIYIFLIDVEQLDYYLLNPNEKDGVSFYLEAALEMNDTSFLPFFVINKIDLLQDDDEKLSQLKEELFNRIHAILKHQLGPQDPQDIWGISCTCRINTNELFPYIEDQSAEYHLKHPMSTSTVQLEENNKKDPKNHECC